MQLMNKAILKIKHFVININFEISERFYFNNNNSINKLRKYDK